MYGISVDRNAPGADKPKIAEEVVRLGESESLRVLTWERDVGDLWVRAADGTAHPYRGSGAMWHRHPEMELAVFDTGSGTRIVGNSIRHFDAPDAILIGSNLPHYWQMETGTRGTVAHIRAWPGGGLWEIPEAGGLAELFERASRGVQFLGALRARAREMVARLPAASALGRVALLLSLLEEARQAPAAQWRMLSSVRLSPSPSRPGYAAVKKAVDLILTRHAGRLDLRRAAEEAGMSRATFTRQFRAHTGKTFSEFLRDVRIGRAARRLLQTDLPVSEIAYEAGFESLSHFNHCFRAVRGQSPGELRRKRGG